MHLRTSIGTGKAPMNAAALSIALSGQRYDVLPQLIKTLHVSFPSKGREHAAGPVRKQNIGPLLLLPL
jgi:hypothetical protein